MTPPFVSVIIPARNSADTLPACLLALRAQSYPRDLYEVIVVSDGSTDRTADIAAFFWARTVSISPSGPGAARNRGVDAAKGELLLFTDADCAPDPGWIRALVAAFDDPEVSAAKGVYRSEQTSLTARFVQAEYESRYRRMRRRSTIDFIDTYSAAYRPEDFEVAGGFDESFRLACVEDQEFSFRLSKLGAKMVFVGNAVVAHRHAADPISYFRKKLKIGYWKMKVLARYPKKTFSDSHTPGGLKLELLSMATCVLFLGVSLLWSPALLLSAFAALAFLGFGTPFYAQIARRTPRLLISAPGFVALRALALGIGCVLGLAGKPFRSRHEEQRVERKTEERIEELVP